MHQHFDKYLNVEELIRAACPRLVVELGASSGCNTRKLLPLCKDLGARLVVVSDGPPAEDVREALDGDCRQALSQDALNDFEDDSVDIAIVDTDHNSWTVRRELELLLKKVRKGGLVLLHDTVAFATGNGYMRSYGTGASYRLEDMQMDVRPYGGVIRGFIGRGFELVRESEESAGAMALRRSV